jgi:hypothetical protein
MEQQAREQAFISALTTEQFVLQAARSANVGEMTGRGTVYMGAVSSALIALGFLAQVVTHLDPFVAAVLPGVFLLGEFTFAALLRNTLENLVLLGQMQRIRGYYRTLVPEADQFFGPAEEDARVLGCDGHGGAAGLAGGDAVHRGECDRRDQQHRGRGRCGPARRQVGHLMASAALPVGIVVAVVLFGLHLLYQQQRAGSLVLPPPAGSGLADLDDDGMP